MLEGQRHSFCTSTLLSSAMADACTTILGRRGTQATSRGTFSNHDFTLMLACKQCTHKDEKEIPRGQSVSMSEPV